MRQQQIDWQDATYRKLIAEVPFPADVPRVGADTLRAVLQAIYDMDRGRPCWPGQQRLAAMAGCCERTVREALAVLEDRLGLIVSYRAKPQGSTSRQTMMHYIIIWTELEMRRQLGNRSLPVDPSTDRFSLPVDRIPLPVDRIPLPVDRIPLPVDRHAHYISARPVRNGKGKEEEKEIPDPVPVEPQAVAGCYFSINQNRLQADNSDEMHFEADNSKASLWSKVNLESDPRLDLPELWAAKQRSIDPLPARWQVADGSWRDLRGSVFSAVKLDALKQSAQMARWHRRQLSAASPWFGPTELDLLMIWALARHAVSCPVEEIRKNRVAYWVHLSVRQKWTVGLRHLSWALDELAALRESQSKSGISEEMSGKEADYAAVFAGR